MGAVRKQITHTKLFLQHGSGETAERDVSKQSFLGRALRLLADAHRRKHTHTQTPHSHTDTPHSHTHTQPNTGKHTYMEAHTESHTRPHSHG